MMFISLVTFNVAIGIALMIAGLSTIESVYFASLLTAFVSWAIIYVKETKRPQVAPTTKGQKDN
ncbi:hypothetical protein [Mammaliicoccus lentus]|uniref:hypothetical protein n=1 Tax=Mammaliicoccus lentus TaxID=42858 RepID=UPI003511F4F9